MTACKPWLEAELSVLDPQVVVALGATAGKALLGPSFRVTKERGQLLPWPPDHASADKHRGAFLVPTVHPSAVLRADLTVHHRARASAHCCDESLPTNHVHTPGRTEPAERSP